MKHSRVTDLNTTANSVGPPLSPLPASPGDAVARWQYLLPIILILYVVIASTHAFQAPIGATGYQDAPDEEAHMTFVRVVAAGRMPSVDKPGVSPADNRPSYEWHQPPLYYFLAARFLPLGNMGVRLLSVLIGVVCILAIFLTARVLFSEQPDVAILAAGIAALIPGHCAITSVVNNDGLLELCFSGHLLLLSIVLTRGLTARRAMMLGSVLGAALLTKATAVLLLPITILALLLLWRNGETTRSVFRSAIIIAGAAAVISGWWFIRNGVLYHEWLPLTAFQKSFEGTVKATDVVSGGTGLPVDSWQSYAALVAQWAFQSFFAVYSTPGGAQIGKPAFLPGQLYLLTAVATFAVMAGLLALLLRRRDEFTRSQMDGIRILVATLGLVTASFVLFTAHYFQAQGRYFYPAMLPISLLSALGWRALFPQRYVRAASVLLLTFLSVFCLAFLRYTA